MRRKFVPCIIQWLGRERPIFVSRLSEPRGESGLIDFICWEGTLSLPNADEAAAHVQAQAVLCERLHDYLAWNERKRGRS